MPLPIIADSCPFPLTPALIDLVNAQVLKAQIPLTQGAILNFRDPAYSPETGGYHPVEISIDRKGIILYITDFAFVGRPPFAELAKELDFDFGLQLFGHMGVDFPLHEGKDIFQLWQRNFVSYYNGSVYKIEVQALE
jgi:hypothetical protein